MAVTVLIALAVVALAVGLFVFRAIPGVRAFFDYHGKRIITCPETHTPEAVVVAAGEAAVGAFLTEPTLRLRMFTLARAPGLRPGMPAADRDRSRKLPGLEYRFPVV